MLQGTSGAQSPMSMMVMPPRRRVRVSFGAKRGEKATSSAAANRPITLQAASQTSRETPGRREDDSAWPAALLTTWPLAYSTEIADTAPAVRIPCQSMCVWCSLKTRMCVCADAKSMKTKHRKKREWGKVSTPPPKNMCCSHTRPGTGQQGRTA